MSVPSRPTISTPDLVRIAVAGTLDAALSAATGVSMVHLIM
jgi:hypothetical protein